MQATRSSYKTPAGPPLSAKLLVRGHSLIWREHTDRDGDRTAQCNPGVVNGQCEPAYRYQAIMPLQLISMSGGIDHLPSCDYRCLPVIISVTFLRIMMRFLVRRRTMYITVGHCRATQLHLKAHRRSMTPIVLEKVATEQ